MKEFKKKRGHRVRPNPRAGRGTIRRRHKGVPDQAITHAATEPAEHHSPRLKATGPVKIEPADFPRDEQGNLKPIWIRACGLSQTMPYCDKSHKACAVNEQPGKLYVYDAARKNVVEERGEG